MKNFLEFLRAKKHQKQKLLAILIDPDKFEASNAESFINQFEKLADFLLIGGSTDAFFNAEKTVEAIKKQTELPVVLFPGDYSQITQKADALLFLSLISGRNPEYLIGQQIKSVSILKDIDLEIIPTAYLLIDGGETTSVEKVSKTLPMPQQDIEAIVDTALAGEYLGKQLIYLEAGSGAKFPVGKRIISEVEKNLSIPIFVGGGIKSKTQIEEAWNAGADVVVVGTAFETGDFVA